FYGDRPERIADHKRDGDPGTLLGSQPCEARHRSGVGAPGLFHQERNAGIDQKAKGLRHIAMPAERHDKLRPRRLDHPAIVGKRRASEALGAVLDDALVAVGDPDDIASEIAQHAQIRRVVSGMPVTDVDRGDALRYAHADPPSPGAFAATLTR